MRSIAHLLAARSRRRRGQLFLARRRLDSAFNAQKPPAAFAASASNGLVRGRRRKIESTLRRREDLRLCVRLLRSNESNRSELDFVSSPSALKSLGHAHSKRAASKRAKKVRRQLRGCRAEVAQRNRKSELEQRERSLSTGRIRLRNKRTICKLAHANDRCKREEQRQQISASFPIPILSHAIVLVVFVSVKVSSSLTSTDL